jgi:hypothetical protein
MRDQVEEGLRVFTGETHIGGITPAPERPRAWRRLLGEPTLHFLVAGALLFAVYPWLAPSTVERTEADGSERAVVVDAARIRSLADGWAEAWQRQPTQAELDGLVEEEVRSEILAREAVRQGLDRDDVAIRTLLREKMELIAEHETMIAEPTPEELAAFYQARQQQFGGGPTVSFVQVLLDPSRRGAALARDAQVMLAQLRADDSLDPLTLGDPSGLAGEYVALPEAQVESLLGTAFLQQLNALEPGTWSGPIASPFGQHLVRLTEQVEVAPPPLGEVLDVVREEWRLAQVQALRDASYARLRERYAVTVEHVPTTTATSSADAAGPPP